jgi:hypothetical protein
MDWRAAVLFAKTTAGSTNFSLPAGCTAGNAPTATAKFHNTTNSADHRIIVV